MIITFNKIQWRNSDDCDIFNIGGINSIKLDTDNCIVTIVGTTNTYKSPFCNLCHAGGITHFKFTAAHPCDFSYYIEITIFAVTDKVSIAAYSSTVPPWFENRCKNYVSKSNMIKDVVAAINFIYKENIDPDDCYIKTPDGYIDLYVNGKLHASITKNTVEAMRNR